MLIRTFLGSWEEVLYSIAPQGWLQNLIGCFITKCHKIWDWWYSKDGKKVYYLKGMVMDVYEPSLVRNYANRPNCWTRSRINAPLVDQGEICLGKDVALAVKSVILHSPCSPTIAPPSTFWEVILGWGNIPGCGITCQLREILTEYLPRLQTTRHGHGWLVYEGDVSIPELCGFCFWVLQGMWAVNGLFCGVYTGCWQLLQIASKPYGNPPHPMGCQRSQPRPTEIGTYLDRLFGGTRLGWESTTLLHSKSMQPLQYI